MFNELLSMKTCGEVAMIAAIVCIGIAHMVGNTMVGLVHSKTGQLFRPPVPNMQLARKYKLMFGADRNYVIYGCAQFAALGLVLIAALCGAAAR